MSFTATSAGPLLKSKLLDSLPGIVHGFGVRGIELKGYLDSLQVSSPKVSGTNQIHGNRVHRLPHNSGASVIEGDAFITDSQASVCFVRTADCVPILIADRKRKAVAAIHAGWRGTSKDIVGEVMRAMRREFGTAFADCVASIGPCISGGRYEVGKEVIDAMGNLGIGMDWRLDSSHVDLKKANETLLIKSGLRQEDVETMPHCTFADHRFASWRRDCAPGERQFNFISIAA